MARLHTFIGSRIMFSILVAYMIMKKGVFRILDTYGHVTGY